ncbi:MAG: A/G-specific adenine glycosylase [Pseudomonadota bacterium]
MMHRRFSQQVIAWHKQSGRKNLPWQTNVTPYRVWVSEIMLQQTQVATVIPYYQRFISRFQDVKALAEASLDSVLQLWAGLGFYARAKNMHKCAQILVTEHDTKFPKNLTTLQKLPGIGISTAGAILSFAFKQRGLILDGNIKRVLSRYLMIEGNLNASKSQSELWKLVEKLTPTQDCAAFNQAMMDIGALICTPNTPQCANCPLQADCKAHKVGQETDFPQKQVAKTIPTKKIFMLILENDEKQILLDQRPPTGIWNNLWCFPICEKEQEITTICKEKYGYTLTEISRQKPFVHRLSHVHLLITPIYAKAHASTVMEATSKWHDVAYAFTCAIPKPVKMILENALSKTSIKK